MISGILPPYHFITYSPTNDVSKESECVVCYSNWRLSLKKNIKKKEYENLSNSNVLKVIGLLSPTNETKPITKKEACEILNIAYNTSRLDKIIADYHDNVDYVAKRKKMNRGKPATNEEITEIVTGYLRGEPIADTAKSLYRSPAFVKSLIERVGVPERVTGDRLSIIDGQYIETVGKSKKTTIKKSIGDSVNDLSKG